MYEEEKYIFKENCLFNVAVVNKILHEFIPLFSWGVFIRYILILMYITIYLKGLKEGIATKVARDLLLHIGAPK